MDVLYLLIGWLAALAVIAGIALGAGVRVVTQYKRGVVLRLGRVRAVRDPGMRLLIPGVDKMSKVSMRVVTMPVPAQEGITRDNVTVRVDAVVYFRVVDPVRALIEVQDYLFAVAQVAQTSLRSIIGKSELDDLLSNREQLNKGLELMIDSPALNWGVHIDRVEIKDVALPDALKRSMSRQAEAERERRARVISAEGELQASEKLAQAAANMAKAPAALQLRFLETVVQVAAEKNSTLVLPFPVELLRFLERSTPGHVAVAQEQEREQEQEAPAQPALAPGQPAPAAEQPVQALAQPAVVPAVSELMAMLTRPGIQEALAALEQPGAQGKTNAAGAPGVGKESA
ncbi:SPFH domain-containing protein [Nocardia seriolae]|uniref:Peptidase n=1 Tax=Nocardia seriolae TaxID=37332 RepID=A0ABC8ASJ3_9NOCA|nr:SPFH domain-containing protein [Nocardia seriolae]APA97169.1 Protein HflK [Nocardia seriolae]QOW34129.1 slipin family protein [Nocardia seriolae]QUN18366.1 slipin family protein [Nocardia seriolae]WKY50659.1 SPFH domain-containing protein [Nocardia seriolae]WNJ61355.1 SPFH domain-containing protein [Nocardia seriolae]